MKNMCFIHLSIVFRARFCCEHFRARSEKSSFFFRPIFFLSFPQTFQQPFFPEKECVSFLSLAFGVLLRLNPIVINPFLRGIEMRVHKSSRAHQLARFPCGDEHNQTKRCDSISCTLDCPVFTHTRARDDNSMDFRCIIAQFVAYVSAHNPSQYFAMHNIR